METGFHNQEGVGSSEEGEREPLGVVSFPDIIQVVEEDSVETQLLGDTRVESGPASLFNNLGGTVESTSVFSLDIAVEEGLNSIEGEEEGFEDTGNSELGGEIGISAPNQRLVGGTGELQEIQEGTAEITSTEDTSI